MFGRGAGLTARRLGCAWALLVAHALIAPAQAALASEASGQRGHSINVRAHRASEDARKRADDTRPEPGSSARADVDRPPQFVVMAFDNCTELERWQELTDFAAQMNKDGDRLHFTFFVSAINFIADASRYVYEGPHQRRGASRINFGGTPEHVRKRVDYVNTCTATATRSPRTRSAISTVVPGRRPIGTRSSAHSSRRSRMSGRTTGLPKRRSPSRSAR